MKGVDFRRLFGLIILGLLLVSFFTVSLNFHFASANGAWWNADWPYRKMITVDHTKVDSDLGSFPVLIDVTDTDLNKAQTNGNDLVFTDDLGVKLNHEIEYFSIGTGRLVAWISVNLSASSDTILYVYYGNSTAPSQQNKTGVWDSDYKMIQHLSETSGSLYDSTSNGNNGTPLGGVSQGVSGKIDGALSFDGTNDVVNFTNIPSLGVIDRITFEAWIKPSSLPGGNYWNLFIKGNDPDVPYQFYLAANTGYLNYYWSFNNIVSSSVAVTPQVWQHVTVSIDGASSTAKFYINGNLVATKTGVLGSDNGGDAQLGGFNANFFNGMMDEVRISRLTRSASWILTEYNNQNNPSAFASVGGEESSSGAPVVSNPSPADGASNVAVTTSQLSFKITDYQNDVMNYSVTTTPNIGSENGVNVGNGVYNAPTSGLGYSTAYSWLVNVTDGTSWSNKTYHFTTRGAITIDLESPSDGVSTVDNEPDFRFTATHLTQPTFTATLWLDGGTPTVYGSKAVSSGASSTITPLSPLLNGDYWWWINCTDGVGISISDKRRITINVFRGDKTFTASYDGSTRYYWLDLPDNFDNSTPTSLVFYLHGFGQSRYAYSQEFPVLRQVFQNHTWIVATVDCRSVPSGYDWYSAPTRQDISDVLGILKHDFTIDSNHIHIMGRSMGGGGSLKYAMFNNQVIASVVDIHGVTNFTQFHDETPSAAYRNSIEQAYGGTPSQVPQVYANESALGNEYRFRHTPVMILHGTADDQVPVSESRNLNQTLSALGYPVKYIETADAHNPPSLVYGREMEIFNWFYDHPLNLGNPKVTLNSPVDNYWSITYPSTITFNSTAVSDPDSRLVSMSLYITDSNNQNFGLYQTTAVSGTSATVTWPVLLGQGTYTWNCLAVDNSSLTGWGTNRTLRLAPDIIPPQWDAIPIDQTVLYGSPFAYSVHATDNVAVDAYSIDDNVNFTVNPSNGMIQNKTVLPIGLYRLTISVSDTSDNVNSTTITVNVLLMGGWWNNNWLYRREITIDHTKVAANLVNFPMLIDFTDSGLISKAQGDGDDIVFTDFNGVKLNHEIEKYDGTSGHIISWVSTNLSSTSNTKLYMYYGNPTATNQQNKTGVWDSDFKIVMHLSETTGTQYDSTRYGNNGVASSGTRQGVSGKIDGADKFEQPEQYVQGTSFSLSDTYSVSMWFKADGLENHALLEMGTTGNRVMCWLQGDEFQAIGHREGSFTGTANANLLAGQWYYAVFTFDYSASPQIRMYINGVEVTLSNNAGIGHTPSLSGNYRIGSDVLYAQDFTFNGTIDEVHISNRARTFAWILTEYDNQNNPSAFTSVGTEETQSGAPVVFNPNPEDGSINVEKTLSNLIFSIADYQHDLMNYYVTTTPNIGSASATGVSGGTYTVSLSGLGYSTTYTWFVNVTDGSNWTNKTYQFTTRGAMTITLNSPDDSISTIDNEPDFKFTATHISQPTFSASLWLQNTTYSGVYATNNAVTSGALTGITPTSPITNGDYWWWINCTDGSTSSVSDKRRITINVFRGDKTFTASYDGSTRSYWLDLPDNFDNSTPTPLVFYLHGYGQSRYAYWQEFPVLRQIFQNHTWIVATVDCRTTGGYPSWYTEPTRQDITDVLTTLEHDYNIDPNHIHIMGRSMGGGGSLKYAMFNPTVIASLVDIHGITNFTQFYIETTYYKASLEAAYGGTPSQVPEVYANESALGNEYRFRHTPVMIIHGTLDDQVNVSESRYLNQTLSALGYTVKYIEVEGAPHNPPLIVYGREMEIFNWFNDHPLNLGNPKVTLNSPADSYWTINYPTNIAFNCTAVSDPESHLVNMSLYITDSNNQNFALYDTTSVSGTTATTTWTIFLGQGTYTWNCIAFDNVSLSGWGTNRTLRLAPDTIPPAFDPLPTNQTIHFGDPFVYDVNASDNIAVHSYFIDDNVNFTMDQSTGLIQSNTVLVAGLYRLTISVNDTSGNVVSTAIFIKVAAPSEWFDKNWPYRKEIVINHSKVTASLANFPVLIDITDSDVAARAQSTGNDIFFTDYYGARLSHEIEKYEGTSGHLVAWVNVPALSSTADTHLYMYYGNSTATNQQNKTGVWDSDFKMVQHLAETSGTHYDSTGYGSNGAPSGGVVQGVVGKINGADSFDGSNDVVNFTSIPSLAITDKITFEAWIKPNSLPGSYWSLFIKGNEPYVPYQFYLAASTGYLNYYWSPSNVVSSGTAVTASVWQLVTISVDSPSSTARFYVNGNLLATKTGVLGPDNGGYALLGGYGAASYFNGMIDEVRISRSIRSDAWISTEYNNQNYTSSFYAIGDEQSSSGAPAISNPSPVDNAVDVPVTLSKLSFKLADFQGDLMNYSVTTSPNIGSGSGTNVANGVFNVSVSGLSSITSYSWTVSATDGKNIVNRTFKFKTELSSIFDPYTGGWLYRRTITIDHTKVAGNLVNFPVLIDFTDLGLASHAQANGNDIVFMNASGVAQRLNHEIEYYSSSTGHLVTWINLPFLSSTTDAFIYMYYGNPTATNQQNKTWVWDSDFKMVQHLSETSGVHYDSTSYGNNGTQYGGVSQGIAGKIDGADQFSPPEKYVQGISFSLPDTYEFSMWLKANTVTGWQTMFEMGSASGRIMCWLNGKEFGALGHGTGYTVTTNANLVSGQWYYVVFTFNYSASPQARMFINGTEVSLSNNNGIGHTPSLSGSYRIGTDVYQAPDYTFSGIIDEMRLSKTVRSISWKTTEYNNQNNPSSFYTIGNEETSKKPTLNMTATSQTCRKYGEAFTIRLNISDALGITGFNFEIHYNATLLDVVGITWDAWTTGTYTTDEINGMLQGYSSGGSINGNITLLTIIFNATSHHIWKDEGTVFGWKNIQTGTIYIQWANMSSSSGTLGYVRGGAQNQINVGPDGTYTFSPIQGDIDNNGSVDITDLRTVAAYYDQPNATYNLTGDSTIDLFDLVVIGANFGYTYSP